MEHLGVAGEGNHADRGPEERLHALARLLGLGDAQEPALAHALPGVDHPQALFDGGEVVQRLDEVHARPAILADRAVLDAQPDVEHHRDLGLIRGLQQPVGQFAGCGCRT